MVRCVVRFPARVLRFSVSMLLGLGALGVAPAPVSAALVTPKIIGGGTIDASTVPWTVAVLSHSQPDAFAAQFCGGSLIATQWVLTAAHCVHGADPASIDVAWGKTNLSSVTGADRHTVSKVISHPGWSSQTNLHDVALLKLTTAVPGAPTIALGTDETGPALGTTLWAYGWGNTSTVGTVYPDDLRGVALQDRSGPTGACGSYGSAFVSEHMVCAGVPGGGKDACQGDSGGPLVAYLPTPVLVGVTSWGNACALANYPGIWSRVSTFVPWINEQMNPQPKEVSVGDATVVEGDAKTRTANLTVTLSSPASSTVSVAYATTASSARNGADFTRKTGTVTFAAGAVSKTISVMVTADTTAEPTETFEVRLTAPSGAGVVLGRATGTVTVLDDDATSGVRLTVGDAAVVEGNEGKAGAVKLTVALSQPAAGPVSVAYNTVAGSAAKGPDFVAKTGTITFPAGAVSKTISISVRPEWLPELGANETLTVTLGSVTGTGVTKTRGTGTITILADD